MTKLTAYRVVILYSRLLVLVLSWKGTHSLFSGWAYNNNGWWENWEGWEIMMKMCAVQSMYPWKRVMPFLHTVFLPSMMMMIIACTVLSNCRSVVVLFFHCCDFWGYRLHGMYYVCTWYCLGRKEEMGPHNYHLCHLSVFNNVTPSLRSIFTRNYSSFSIPLGVGKA